MGKNTIKKLISTIICFCMVVSVITISSTDLVKVSAGEETKEWESNNIITEANAITKQSSVTGKLENSDDDDWFKFYIPEDGVVYLDFKHKYIDSGTSYWKTTIVSPENKEVAHDYWTGNDLTGAHGKYIGLKTGIWYLKVDRGDYYSDETYTFVINFDASPYWEKGLNETIVDADKITLNKKIGGTIVDRDDNDWFTFAMPKDGVIWITFDHDYIDSGVSFWETYFYSSDNKELVGLYWNGNTLVRNLAGCKVGLPAGTYCLKVRRGDYYSDLPYYFTINYLATEGWEKESNNVVVNATAININSLYHGSVMYQDDYDWYKFTLSSPGSVRFLLRHDYIDSGAAYWDWELYDAETKDIKSGYVRGNTLGDYFGESILLDSGVYYLKIKKGDYYSYADYIFSVDYSMDGFFTDERIDVDKLTANSDYSDESEEPVNKTNPSTNDTKNPVNNTGSSDAGKTDPAPSGTNELKDDSSVTIGTIFTDGKLDYKVSYEDEVIVIGLKDKSLTTITIPKTIKYQGVTFEVADIAKNAFVNNKKITKVTIKADLDTIGENAFSGCEGITRVDLTGDITTIGRKAFYKCKKLSQIYITTDCIEEIESKSFSKIKSSVQVKVPKGMKKDYTTLLKKGGLPKKAQIKE